MIKKTFLKSFLLLLCMIVGGASSAWGDTTVTFTFNTDAGLTELGITKPSSGAGTDLGPNAYTKSSVSLSATSGGTATRVWNSKGTLDLRIYTNGTFTFSAPGVVKTVVFAGQTVNVFSCSKGTFSSGTWTAANNATETSVTLTATGTGKINTITVTYTPAVTTHTLTYSATNGSIGGVVYNTSTVVASGASVEEDGKVTLTATPDDGYEFSNWEVSGIGSSLLSTTTNPTTFTMGTANATVTANFVATGGTPTYTLTITPPTGGTITVLDSEANEVSSGQKFEESTKLTIGAEASTGYTFTTWTKTAGTFSKEATTADNTFTMPGSTATIGATFTLNTHTLSLTSSNGTCVTTVNGEEWDGSSKIPYGAAVVVTATPRSGYLFDAWVCSYASVTENDNEISFTMPDEDVTLTASYSAIPTHTVTFSVNGATTFQDYAEGATITFPSNPADISGKKFVGWYTAEYTHASTAPTFVNTATAKMGDSDVTYYAVFAEVTNGSAVTDELTTSTFGSPSSYTSWSNKTASSDAKYAGQSSGGSSYIQLRASSPSGIVSTASGGNVTKVTVSWDTSTPDDRTLDVYGKTSAYSGSSDLYNDSNKGTLLGSLYHGVTIDKVKTTTTELTISGNYQYVGLRSKSGAMYLDEVDIQWTPTTISDYSTSVEVFYTVTYDANGATSGVVPTDDTEYEEEEEVTVLGNTGKLAKTDYIFSGWNTQADGEGADFDEDDTFDITSDVTLYAKWTEKTNSDLAVTSSSPVALEMTTANPSLTSTITWTTSSEGAMSFVSDKTSVATVTSAGVITAVGAGTAKITISQAASESYKASGNLEVTVNVTDNRTACATGIDLPTAQKTLIKGNSDDFAATSTKEDGFTGSITYTYETSDADVVAVTTGTYSAEDFGTAKITIIATPTGGNAANYKPASQEVDVTVKGENSISLDPTSKTVTYSTSTFDIAAIVPTDNYNGTVSAISDNTFVATVSVDGTTVTVTPHAVGSAKITVTAGAGTYYPETASADCNVTFTAPVGSTTAPSSDIIVFNETFDGFVKNSSNVTTQGGNDNGQQTGNDIWSGNAGGTSFATVSSYCDESGWSVTSGGAGYKCAKFGTGSVGGSATTPNIDLEEDIVYTLTFKAGAWNRDGEGTSLSVSATNATIKNEANTATVSSVTTVKGSWTSYTLKLIVTDESDPVKITFSTDGGNKRFFLDEVKVFYEQDPTATVTLTKNGYATYCSVNPIDFSSTEGYTAWRVTGIEKVAEEEGVIRFTKITEKIKGGQGVLLYNKNADGEKTSTATIKFADGTTEFTSSENLLVGTTAPTFVEQEVDDYYTNFALSSSNSDFRKIKAGGMVVPANKAYLPVLTENISAGARLTFVFEDGQTTTIQGVSVRKTVPDTYYNMKGQRVDNPKKGGIYVKNGKKVIFK